MVCRSDLARMREPVLTPEQAAAARRAAALEHERSHAAAEQRRAAMLQVNTSGSSTAAPSPSHEPVELTESLRSKPMLSTMGRTAADNAAVAAAPGHMDPRFLTCLDASRSNHLLADEAPFVCTDGAGEVGGGPADRRGDGAGCCRCGGQGRSSPEEAGAERRGQAHEPDGAAQPVHGHQVAFIRMVKLHALRSLWLFQLLLP